MAEQPEDRDLLADIMRMFPDLADTSLGAYLKGEAVGVETSLGWLGDRVAEWGAAQWGEDTN